MASQKTITQTTSNGVVNLTESPCDLCKGSGKNQFDKICCYCNGTGEWNDAAASFMKNHICQCILLDRKFCPVCELKCHHDTSLNPKQIIDSGYGGMSATTGTITLKEEEEIIA